MGWLWFLVGAWCGSCGTAIAMALVIDRADVRARTEHGNTEENGRDVA